MDPERTAVVNALSNSPIPLGINDVAYKISKGYDVTSKLLARMVDSGQIEKVGRGRYSVSPDQIKLNL